MPSVVVFPEAGERAFPLILQASLYFDRVYLLDSGLSATGRDHFNDLTLPGRKDEIDKAPTVGQSALTRYLESSLALQDHVLPLQEAGIVEFIDGDGESSMNVSQLQVWLSDWLDRAEEFGPAAGPGWSNEDGTLYWTLPDSVEESFDLCDVPLSVWQLTCLEMGSTATKGHLRAESGNEGLIHFLSFLDVAAHAAQIGAQPLTNHPAHHEAMGDALCNVPPIRGVMDELAQTECLLGQRIISTRVPFLREMNAEGVLEVRRKFEPELIRLRRELSRLSADILNDPWQKNIGLDVERCIRRHVDPAIDDLQRALDGAPLRFVRNIVGDLAGITGATVPFVGFLVAGYEFPQAAATTAAVSFAQAAIRTRVDGWMAKKQSSITYLLELRKAVPVGARRDKSHA